MEPQTIESNDENCQAKFQASLVYEKMSPTQRIKQLLAGKGFILKHTNSFYSSYRVQNSPNSLKWAIVILTVVFYLFCIVIFLLDLKKDFTRLLSTMKSKRNNITNIIFGSWNFNFNRPAFIEKMKDIISKNLEVIRFIIKYYQPFHT